MTKKTAGLDKRPRLMIPGPVEVRKEVLEAMSDPIDPHYGDGWVEEFREICSRARRVFQTEGQVFVIPGSGTAAIEASLNALDSADSGILVLSNGTFGRRLGTIASACVRNAYIVECSASEPISSETLQETLSTVRQVQAVAVVHCETSTGVVNSVEEIGALCARRGLVLLVDAVSSLGGMDVKTDEWSIDICITASQKALEAPAGLGIVSVSEKAWCLIDKSMPGKSWYSNLKTWKTYSKEWSNWHPSPVTMPVNNIRALGLSLQYILSEGLGARFARHARAAATLREGMRSLGLAPYAKEAWASDTVTAVLVSPEKRGADHIRRTLREVHSILVADGTDELKGRAFRVGHMGLAATEKNMDALIRAVALSLQMPRVVDSTSNSLRDICIDDGCGYRGR